MDLYEGLSSTVEAVVKEEDTALAYGSGSVHVLATPAMIALMEKASLSAVNLHLDEGYTSVGTSIDIKHVSATPVGMKVKVKSELIKIDGKKLSFKVEAYDESGLIGKGTHERYIVCVEKFIKNAEAKKSEK